MSDLSKLIKKYKDWMQWNRECVKALSTGTINDDMRRAILIAETGSRILKDVITDLEKEQEDNG